MASASSPASRWGLLVVGLAGNNGVTLLAGQVANKRKLTWEGPQGPQAANCYGCITQVGSLARSYPRLPALDDLVVGGWDVRASPLGQALYEARVLDYDLVRQVREEMDEIAVMPGVFDPSFVGESQHAGATHVVADAPRAELLERLRSDIGAFRAEHGLGGHLTVVWSASVERPSEVFATADALRAAIAADDPEVSPSLLYAAAAVLEGCSFVNGGSQNTVQAGLVELAAEQARRRTYVLGTDFKAGQTKAKTAIIEYLRAIGLRPRTVASYNHLGNNDMRNLLSPATWGAKARVKTDIFSAWADDGPIDHKVAVLYTPQMGDEKRDTVEYSSDGFMGCAHTMLTYTRCMDSALCVPLMIDAAAFCDYFSDRDVPPARAAAALSYLFKLNEGG